VILPRLEIDAHLLAASLRHGEGGQDKSVITEESRRRIL